jgi:hypothetical protein
MCWAFRKRSCAEENSVKNFKAVGMSRHYLESTLRKNSFSLTNRFLRDGFDNRSDEIIVFTLVDGDANVARQFQWFVQKASLFLPFSGIS